VEQQQSAARAAAIEGIDVSRYQGVIDWGAAARAGVRFALVRAGWGGYEGGIEEGFDPRFAANSTGARAAGLGVGAYLYSYMKTPAAAHAAAAGFLRLALPFSPDYPLVLDFEDSPTYAGQSKSKNTDIARTFLEDLEAGGCYAMLYTYTSFAESCLLMNRLAAYDLWLADYRSRPGYRGSWGIWQYSGSGRVAGISGAVDLDRTDRDYPALIRAAGLNGLGTAGPQMEALENTELEVFGSKNCQFFTAPDNFKVAGSLENGRYRAVARSTGVFAGFSWVLLLMAGSVWWTALLGDRCRLLSAGARSRAAEPAADTAGDGGQLALLQRENAFLRGALADRCEQLDAVRRALADSAPAPAAPGAAAPPAPARGKTDSKNETPQTPEKLRAE